MGDRRDVGEANRVTKGTQYGRKIKVVRVRPGEGFNHSLMVLETCTCSMYVVLFYLCRIV